MAESRKTGNRNRNRNRNRNSGSNPRRNRRYVKQKVPRKPKKKSLLRKLLDFIGLGEKNKKSNKKQRGQNRGKKRPQANKKQPRNSRPPEKIPVTSERLYVGNISYKTTDANLMELFEKFGGVRTAEVVKHSRNARSKGYAFVEKNNADAARKAAEELHDLEYMGRKIIVNGAKSRGKTEG